MNNLFSSTHSIQESDWRWLNAFVKDYLIPAENAGLENSPHNNEYFAELHNKGFLRMLPFYPDGFENQEIDVRANLKDTLTYARFHRELGYGSASASAATIANSLGLSAIVCFANYELRQQLVKHHINKFSWWSFAMSEAVVGSELSATRTIATEIDGGGFNLNGEKNYITNAGMAEHIVVFAQLLARDGKERGISAFYLPGDAAGLKRGRRHDTMSFRRSFTGTLHFENVQIPREHLIGAPGDGLKILGKCLNRSKVALAATGAGIAQRAIDITVERLSNTRRFKQLLIEQPVIRHLIARLSTKVEASWLLAARAAQAWDSQASSTKESSMAKLFAGGVASEVTAHAVDLFGSLGLMAESEVSRLARDAKAVEILEGPTFIQESLIIREVLQKPRSATEITRRSNLELVNNRETQKAS